MCIRCAALEEEIQRLRERLAERLDADLVRVVTQAFGLTSGQSRVVALLYQARSVVSIFDLEDAIHADHAVERSLDGNIVSVYVYQIRRAIGREFILSTKRVGYVLSDEGRRYVAQAIAAAAETRIAEAPKPPQPDPSAWQTDWTPMLGWLDASRRDGVSYRDIGKAIGVTRNAVAGAVHRHLRTS